jgi:hypothetical protein
MVRDYTTRPIGMRRGSDWNLNGNPLQHPYYPPPTPTPTPTQMRSTQVRELTSYDIGIGKNENLFIIYMMNKSDPITIPNCIPVKPERKLPLIVGSWDTCSDYDTSTSSGFLRSLTPLPFSETPIGYPCTPPSFRCVPLSPAFNPCGWCQKPHPCGNHDPIQQIKSHHSSL